MGVPSLRMHAALAVHHHAAQGGLGETADHRWRSRGAVVGHRHQGLGVLAEVLVLALGAELVVAAHGLHQRLGAMPHFSASSSRVSAFLAGFSRVHSSFRILQPGLIQAALGGHGRVVDEAVGDVPDRPVPGWPRRSPLGCWAIRGVMPNRWPPHPPSVGRSG